MQTDNSDTFKTLLQILALLCVLAILSMIFHKGFTDVATLAQEHSGAKFWLAFGRYLLANLSGG
jgi:hypothetical protein